jgi:hypothetical protein
MLKLKDQDTVSTADITFTPVQPVEKAVKAAVVQLHKHQHQQT